jgi:hypothetical protein
MEVACSSETSVHAHQNKQLRIPEDSHRYCGKDSPQSDDVAVVWRFWYGVFIASRNLHFSPRILCVRDDTSDCAPDAPRSSKSQGQRNCLIVEINYADSHLSFSVS